MPGSQYFLCHPPTLIRSSYYMNSQLYLFPNMYGVVMLVGLMLVTFICYIHGL